MFDWAVRKEEERIERAEEGAGQPSMRGPALLLTLGIPVVVGLGLWWSFGIGRYVANMTLFQDIPFIVIVLLVLLFVIAPVGSVAWYLRDRKRRNQAFDRSGLRNAIQFSVGRCVAGLPNTSAVVENLNCYVDREDFIFLSYTGTELARIPRNRVKQVLLEDRSTVMQRLTMTRIALLGVFALAAPQSREVHQEYVSIDWNDSRGVRQDTVFEFKGFLAREAANACVNELRRYCRAAVPPPSPAVELHPELDASSRLKRIEQLKLEGLLTTEEYNAKRAAIIEDL